MIATVDLSIATADLSLDRSGKDRGYLTEMID